MRKLLLICLLIGPLLCKAQSTTEPAKNTTPHDTYCMLVAQDKFLSTYKVSISIDYGQDTQFTDQHTKDENAKVTTYNTIVDALNFMAQKGWVFVNNYTITNRGVSSYYYILKYPADAK